MSNRLKTALAIGGLATMLMTSQARAGLDGNPFEGLYLGFNANYSKVTADATYEILDANTNSFGGISSSSNSTGYGGVLYGGIGTNVWGPMYVGIEAGLGVNGGTSFVTDGTNTVGLKAGFSLDITTRVGMTVSDRVLVYALGGYTSIKFSNKGFANGQSKGLGGYRYGAGFEVGIMEDIALRVEYVRTAHAAVTWTQAGDSFRFDPSTQVFRIGVVLHMD